MFLRRTPRARYLKWIFACAGVAVVIFGCRFGLSWCCTRLARQALARHDVANAVGWLDWARTFNHSSPEAHFLAARACRRLGDSGGLQKNLELAHRLGWPARDLEREWILAQAQAGLLKQAEPHLQKLLINPGEDGAEICAAFVSGFAHHYQFQRVFLLLDVWEKDFPDDPEPHLMRGKLQQRWRNWQVAESEYREVLKRQPNQFEAVSGLAEVLATQHRYDEAMQLFSTNLKVEPDHSDLLKGKADCLIHFGRHDEASAIYRQLLAKDENDCSARLGLGRMALDASRSGEALSWLEPAVAACPQRPEVLYVLAQALVAAGRQEEAKTYFRQFEEVNSALIKVSELTMHLVEHPNDLEARFDVGRLYMKYGTREEGANWLKTVLAIAPSHQPTHALLAEHYDEIGEKALAQEHRSQVTAVESATAALVAPPQNSNSNSPAGGRTDAQR